MKLFGTDGIRASVGVFPMTPEFVLRLGRAAGAVLKELAIHPVVVIGRDTRASSPMLQSALSAGLLASGVSVVDLGVIPTPGVAFLAPKFEAVAGVVLSASHNPAEQNGIKFFQSSGFKLSEEVEARIENLALNGDAAQVANARFGQMWDGSGAAGIYKQSLISEHGALSFDSLTIVLDCANGATSAYASECFAQLGARVITINASPSGSNINQAAGSEFVRKYPGELARVVEAHAADLGMAFDGDGDRVVFIDRHGRVLDGDYLIAILADYFDARQQLLERTIVATSMRNAGLVDFVNARGLGLIETKVGDKYVSEKLVEIAQRNLNVLGVGLGGEQAGHVVILDKEHTAGDGIRTGLYVVRALVESEVSDFSALANRLQKKPQVIASAHVSAKPPFEEREELKTLAQRTAAKMPGLSRSELRYSGTEPQFRAMLEADERHSVSELANEAWLICRTVQRVIGKGDTEVEILNCMDGGLLFPQTDVRRA